ncbi:8-oxoguanine glycosylase ogg1 [Gaertneriomyces sp. JEL0708]|nr:8-oxoguanine glycosylase ogg1 [Gaertneriomyces sp. JEL0708]
MSAWHSLDVSPTQLRIDTTLNCGQSFRWVKTGDNEWTSVLSNNLISLRQTEEDTLYNPHSSDPAIIRSLLYEYFQLGVDLEKLYAHWNQDANFALKASSFTGLRTLQQDPFETLLVFICTSCNNIPRITSMISSLCHTYGTYISTYANHTFHAFPDLTALSHPNIEEKLRALGFGYRAKYIASTVAMLNQRGLEWLYALRHIDYSEAKTQLLQLSGVGPKIADCILLMSLNHTSAVPVDTHVYQIALRDYAHHLPSPKRTPKTKTLSPNTYTHIQTLFGKVFGDRCGWAQTVLFTADLRYYAHRPLINPDLNVGVEECDGSTKVEVKVESDMALIEDAPITNGAFGGGGGVIDVSLPPLSTLSTLRRTKPRRQPTTTPKTTTTTITSRKPKREHEEDTSDHPPKRPHPTTNIKDTRHSSSGHRVSDVMHLDAVVLRRSLRLRNL